MGALAFFSSRQETCAESAQRWDAGLGQGQRPRRRRGRPRCMPAMDFGVRDASASAPCRGCGAASAPSCGCGAASAPAGGMSPPSRWAEFLGPGQRARRPGAVRPPPRGDVWIPIHRPGSECRALPQRRRAFCRAGWAWVKTGMRPRRPIASQPAPRGIGLPLREQP